MYPFPILLLGPSDGSGELATALADQGATIEGRFADLHGLRTLWKPADDKPRLFVLRMQGDEDIKILHELNETFPGFPLVALIEGTCDSSTMFRVSRAGAAQLISFPVQPDDVAAALNAVLRQFGGVRRVGSLIAVAAVPEGRDGAAFTVNLAHEIAHGGADCILAEPSSRLGRLLTYLDVSRADAESSDGRPPPRTLTALQQSLVPVRGRLRVLPARRGISTKPVESALLGRLTDLLRQATEAVVLDVPQTYDEPFFETLCRSEHVLLVTEQTVPALNAAKEINGALAAWHPIGIVRIVLNHFDPNLEGFGPDRVRELLNVEEVWTVARDGAAWAGAVNTGQSLRTHSPHSLALADIERIARRLLDRCPATGRP